MVTTKNHVYILIGVAVAGSLLYFYFDPANSNYFPPCPFFSITGLYCPGCGSQRAFHDLLHGDIKGAASHNLLFISALPFIGISAAVTTNNIFSAKKKKQQLFYSGRFAIIVLITVLVFWVLRNLPFQPFLWLAP